MSGFRVSRSVAVAAAPDTVRALVDDLRRWQQWSPWEGLDPGLQRTYTGPDTGVRARYAWVGNRKAGAGSMEIVDSSSEVIDIRLEFLKPWRATHDVQFRFVPEGDGTRVTWSMSGTNTGLAAVFARFLNYEKLIGPDFEKGLARLKALAES